MSNQAWQPYPDGFSQSMHHAQPQYPYASQQVPSSHSSMYQPLPDSSNANDGSWRIRVVQQPTNAKAAQGAKEKSRSPIDPPPIVKLDTFPHLSLHDPYIMVVASSVPTGKHEGESSQQHAKNMTGSMVSSLHRLKDLQNQESGFFIFPDLLIKIPGDFKLHFALMKMKTNPSDPGDLGEWETVAETDSDPFKVYTSKDYPGMAESTVMTRSFSDQGVKVRLRKDSRKLTTAKRNHQVAQNARNTRSAKGEVDIDEPLPKRSRNASTESQGYGMPIHHRGSIQTYPPVSGFSPPGTQQFYSSPPFSGASTPAPASSNILPSLNQGFHQMPNGQLYNSPIDANTPTNNWPVNPSPQHSFAYNHRQSLQFSQPAVDQTANLPSITTHVPPQQHPVVASVHASPQGQSAYQFGTSSASSVSPEGPGYTFAPELGVQYQNYPNIYENGTSRHNGIPTPLTGNMPPEPSTGAASMHFAPYDGKGED